MTYALPDNMTLELVTAPPDWPASGDTIASVRKGERERIFLILHPPPDWRNYKALSFLAASIGASFSLDVAIRYTDPATESPSQFFERGFVLSAEAQRFSIAFDEFAMLQNDRATTSLQVESLTFSPTHPGSEQHLLIDDIRLETL